MPHEYKPEDSVPNPEARQESFSSLEEMREVFQQWLQGRAFVETKNVSDEHGLSSYEVESTDAEGRAVDISFGRARNNVNELSPGVAPGARFSASIHLITYEDGMPTGGDGCRCLANYLNGVWINVD